MFEDIIHPQKALVFRIIHRDNLPWVWKHGLHSRSSNQFDPDYVSIGASSIIEKRAMWTIPVPPGGTLADYIPFYFTPASIMLYNILTGRGVSKRDRPEIIILIASLLKLEICGYKFLFTNKHAVSAGTNYLDELHDLTKIDWSILQKRDFKRDPDNDPDKCARYQAEALIHRHLDARHLTGIACYDNTTCAAIESQLQAHGLDLPVRVRADWYFR